MKKPLVWLVLFFCAGILFANFNRPAFLCVYICGLVALILAGFVFKNNSRFDLVLLSLAFLLGAILLINYRYLPRYHVSRYLTSIPTEYYIVKGHLVSQPVLKTTRGSFILNTKAIQAGRYTYGCCGNLLVYAICPKLLSYGDEVVLRGSLLGYRYSGRGKYQDYLANQGIYSVIKVSSPGDLLKLNSNKGYALKKFSLRLKNQFQLLIAQHVSSGCAAILEAMVLGEKKNIPPRIYDSMIKTGTVHILVVSGFNVGIVTFIITLFLKILRIKRALRFFLCVFLLIIYCLITGASTPVVRATVMAIIFMFAYWVKREPDIHNSCALAALLILCVNPCQLFDVGFQLSFASVISIVCLYPRIKSILPIGVSKLGYLIDGGLVSFSAWAGTMGFIAYYFRAFSPVTVLANLFIVPLASLITLLGFSLGVVALICPGLAVFFAAACETTVSIFLKINLAFLKLPFACLRLP